MSTGTTHKTSVLVVEDERLVALDLQQTLDGMGFAAYATAASAEEALERASQRCPDIVLMDIRIKGELDGIETARLLRRRFDVPVIYLTAYADDATMARAKQTYPHGYLLKPIKAAELRSAIEVTLQRHRLEGRVRQERNWLSTTLQSLSDAVIVSDNSGYVTLLNPAAEQLLGIRADHAIGQAADELVPLLLDKRRVFPFAEVLNHGSPITVPSATLISPTRGERIISDSVSPVRDQRRMLGAVMVIRDITEEHQLQRQLSQTARVASLGTMAAGVAHELNNPLSVVLANAPFVHGRVRELIAALEKGSAPSKESLELLEEVATATQEMQRAARRAGKVVEQLRRSTRRDEGITEVRGVAEIAKTAVRATARLFEEVAQVLIDESIAAETGPYAARAVTVDSSRLEQVLVNLLTNAAQAMPTGRPAANHVTIRQRCEPTRLVIEVVDTGPGISEDLLRHVLDPFFTTKRESQGTGLGLAICNGIMVAAGGSLELDSELGTGTTARLSLPYAIQPSQPPPQPADKHVRGRILVVDDDEAVLTATARCLEQHRVVCVTSAEEALGRLEDEDFDLVVCDLKMPDMTGMDFLHNLKRSGSALASKVLFSTGGATTPEEKRFLHRCPQPYIHKPFEPVQLQKVIQELLANEPSRAPA